MRTILHIIFQKSAIKLCLIVLFMFVFINESFPQSYDIPTYSPKRYSGSYDYSLYEISGFLGLNRYEISVTVEYRGGGEDYTYYGASITDYLYVSEFTFGNTYSYSVIRRNVNINDEKMVIFYDSSRSCPNYNEPCNISGHEGNLVVDWATRVNFRALYDLQITRRTDALGQFFNWSGAVRNTGFRATRKFYNGRMFNNGYRILHTSYGH